MSALSAQVDRHLAGLRQGLADLHDQRGLPVQQVSARFGRHRTYWGRVLAGRLEPKVEEVFQVLYEAEVPGDQFVSRYVGPGGPPLTGVPRRRLDPGLCDHWDGEIWCDWLRRRLLAVVEERGLVLRDVARVLGLPADAPSRALGGYQRLTFRLVFGLLLAAGIQPWRFFVQISAGSGKLPGGTSLDQVLDLAQRMLDSPPEPRES